MSDLLRAAFASCVLGAWSRHRPRDGRTLGGITLHEHQHDAVARCRALIAAHGGALLADQVGLGKTFVALALAREMGDAIVVAPAALREQWTRAATRAGMRACPFVSFEALSRGAVPRDDAALVIVDEAHHLRSAHTRRHRTMARLGQRRPLLLMTATPVHNRARDLAVLLSLVMGERALRASLAELQLLVVRRTDATIAAVSMRPIVEHAPPLRLPESDDLLHDITTLPSPVPPRDGGRADALVTLGLLRAWASSDAALVAALRRRLAMARALDDALTEGRHPTRAELAAWTESEGIQQLALPLLVTTTVAPSRDAAEWHARVVTHADAVRELLARLAAHDSPRDAARAEWLLSLRRRHGDHRLLAFTHSAETARALYRRLRAAPGIAVLTADGGDVAGGRLTRDAVLDRFAPRARGAAPPPAHSAVHLLIATDLLAEGLDLQETGLIVHLDMPWTPARLEQRVGRVARPGAIAATVRVYAIAPPASAEAVVRVEARLRAKLADVERCLGGLPLGRTALLEAPRSERSALEASEAQRALLARWRRGAEQRAPATEPTMMLASATAGWVAFVHDTDHGASGGLVAGTTEGASDDPGVVLDALQRLDSACDLGAARLDTTTALLSWRAHRAGAVRAGLAPGSAVPSRHQRRALTRVSTAMARVAPHQRAQLGAMAQRARRALSRPPSAQRDAQLGALMAAHPVDDAAWLAQLAILDGDGGADADAR